MDFSVWLRLVLGACLLVMLVGDGPMTSASWLWRIDSGVWGRWWFWGISKLGAPLPSGDGVMSYCETSETVVTQCRDLLTRG